MHPIFALWSHPRSMSTATERIMRERGDLTCFHEPFMYDYYIHRQVRVMPHFAPDPGRPVDYPAIRDQLLAAGEAGPVFFKDMSYYVVPALFEDEAFARRVRHCFLIRDPLRALVSYYRLDPHLTLEEVGLEAQWRQLRWLEEALGVAAVVLEAEAVQRDPRATMAACWQRLGLADAPHAFAWSNAAVPADWGQVGAWHGQASESRGIDPPRPQEAAETRAAFETVAAEAPHLRDYLAHHLPAYEALKARARS